MSIENDSPTGRELDRGLPDSYMCRVRMGQYRRRHLRALACDVHDFHDYAETAADRFLTRSGTGGCVTSRSLFQIIHRDGAYEVMLSMGRYAEPDALRAMAAAEAAYIAALEEFHARALDRIADEEARG